MQKNKLILLNLDIYSYENFYKNIYYPWKRNNLCFKWYSIYENNKTKINTTTLDKLIEFLKNNFIFT